MKAIISSRRRSQVYDKNLNYLDLNNFIKEYFPRMREPQLNFKDVQGNTINVKSNDDL
jgi:hypothetical protein